MITLSRQQIAEQELERLALAVVRSLGSNHRDEWSWERKLCVADLLVFLDVLTDTPQAKRDWIEGR
jgi:hypothetical protein